jgi:3-oxoacyl-[acyl-carrier protein] reductase
MNLQNSTVLVTGGTSGIGRATARVLRDAGARVAITGRDESRLRAVTNELGVLAVRADVTDEADVERTYAEVLRQFGHLDALVNNAGAGAFKPLVEMTRAEFDSIIATNVTGAMLMARGAARHFVQRRKGNSVHIGSTAALRGAPNGTAYYASKFALRGMTECWRTELRQHNVRVCLVNPSEVITDFLAHAGQGQRSAATDNPTKLRAEEIAHTIKSVLELDDRGFVTEITVFATNPKD